MWIAVFFYRSFFIMIRHQPKQLRKSSLDYHRFAACLIPPQKTEIILWPLSKYVVHLAELWAKAMLSIHVQSNIFKHVPWKKRIPLVPSLDFSSPPQKKRSKLPETNSLLKVGRAPQGNDRLPIIKSSDVNCYFQEVSGILPKPELRAFLLCAGHLPCWLLKEEPLWSMRWQPHLRFGKWEN